MCLVRYNPVSVSGSCKIEHNKLHNIYKKSTISHKNFTLLFFVILIGINHTSPSIGNTPSNSLLNNNNMKPALEATQPSIQRLKNHTIIQRSDSRHDKIKRKLNNNNNNGKCVFFGLIVPPKSQYSSSTPDSVRFL